MHALVPLPVAVPLLAAAVLAAGNTVLPRWAIEALALSAAIAVLAMCAVLLAHAGTLQVHWFSGFHPRRGVALGISFAVDRAGAGMATLAALLVTASLLYASRYFDQVGALFSVLMLVFLAAMVGFSLTGDLFNLFVFFELMSVAAYALTAYKTEEAGPLQGAINFAISNSVGSFAMLTGIALLYGHTGALNLAQIGAASAAHPAPTLTAVAFALVAGGLLVKAAVAPLHFWLADAHAVAPVPVCVLFSGVMVELGLYGVARVYWVAFASQHSPGTRVTLIAFGILTALVGAWMCVAQRHIKRLLAFSTISHSGVFLIALGLLTPAGLAAGGTYLIEHGLLKGALFMSAGILLHRFGSVDEHELQGRARGPGLRAAGAVFAIAGLGLAALPPLGAFTGKSLLEHALTHTPGWGWAVAVLVLSSALTGGAILRVAARVFGGWGPPTDDEPPQPEEQPETLQPHDRTPAVMVAPMVALTVLGMLIGLVPGIHRAAADAAAQLAGTAAYAARVLELHGAQALAPLHVPPPEGVDYALAAVTVAGAVCVAALGLRPAAPGPRWPSRVTAGLRRLHSGCANDYVAWIVAGLAALGGALALS